jgi:hypothetical protein
MTDHLYLTKGFNMTYITIVTQEEITAEQIIAAWPNVNFPEGIWSDEFLLPYGYANAEAPIRQFEVLKKQGARAVDDVWEVIYKKRPVIPTEPAALAIFLEVEKNKLKDQIADIRWQMETSGIILENGMKIRTDRESQSKVAEAVLLFQYSPNSIIHWKANGTWIEVNAAMMVGVALKVGEWIQKCFYNERLHWDAINALQTIDEVFNYQASAHWRD